MQQNACLVISLFYYNQTPFDQRYVIYMLFFILFKKKEEELK